MSDTKLSIDKRTCGYERVRACNKKKNAPIVNQGRLKVGRLNYLMLSVPIPCGDAVDVFTCFNVSKVCVSVLAVVSCYFILFAVKFNNISFHLMPSNDVRCLKRNKVFFICQVIKKINKINIVTLLSKRQTIDSIKSRVKTWIKRLYNRKTWAGISTSVKRGTGVNGMGLDVYMFPVSWARAIFYGKGL